MKEYTEVKVLVKLSNKIRHQLFQKDEVVYTGKIYLIPEKNRFKQP